MKKLFYLGQWFLRARLFGRKAPLQTVLFISDVCNLRCKHCNVYELKNPHNMTYEQVREHLQYSYDLGSRFVDFEGGEVTIWKDGDYRINDLIDLAKKIGFFSCTITTNAQLPFAGSHADSIWVSLDGINFHEEVRGKGTIAKLEKNIAELDSVTTMLAKGMSTLDMCKEALKGFEVEVLDEFEVKYVCGCSKEKIESLIESMPKEEIEEMIEKDHGAKAGCHFCNKPFEFTEAELKAILSKK
mgnify:CR=1 FL=1